MPFSREKKIAFDEDLMKALVLLDELQEENQSEVFRCTCFSQGDNTPVDPMVQAKCKRVRDHLRQMDTDRMHVLTQLHEDGSSPFVIEPTLTLDYGSTPISASMPPSPFEVEAMSFMGFVHLAQFRRAVLYDACPIDLSRPAFVVRIGDAQAILSTMAMNVLRQVSFSTWKDFSYFKSDLAADPNWDVAKDVGAALMLLDQAGIVLTEKHRECVRQVLVQAAWVDPAFIERFAPPLPQGHNQFVAGLIALEESVQVGNAGRIGHLAVSAPDHIVPANGQTSLLHYYSASDWGHVEQICVDLIAAGHPLKSLDEHGHTPLDIAVAKGHRGIEQLLRSAMARHEARTALSMDGHASLGF